MCGVPAVQKHRIIPGSMGGKYEKGNVILLCPTCHEGIHVLMSWIVEQSHHRWQPWGRVGEGKRDLVGYYLGRKVGRFFLRYVLPRFKPYAVVNPPPQPGRPGLEKADRKAARTSPRKRPKKQF